jgi:TatD DNase family protein
MFFDSHCHLDHPLLSPDLPRLLAAARLAGVTGFLVPGVAASGWQQIAALTQRFPTVRAAFGTHPLHADLLTPPALDELERLAPVAAAIGEIGLDYLATGPTREVQRAAFRAQLKIAVAAGLPVLLHCRKACADLLAIFDEEGGQRTGGVMHAFSGSADQAAECLRRGLYIGVAGPVTWPGARRPLEVVAAVPLERLLLETDAPDLAPHPHRGTPNLPEYLVETARAVARIKGVTLEQLAGATSANAARLFGAPTAIAT